MIYLSSFKRYDFRNKNNILYETTIHSYSCLKALLFRTLTKSPSLRRRMFSFLRHLPMQTKTANYETPCVIINQMIYWRYEKVSPEEGIKLAGGEGLVGPGTRPTSDGKGGASFVLSFSGWWGGRHWQWPWVGRRISFFLIFFLFYFNFLFLNKG